MIETLAFRTQARTVDHLGREQIADCPTAISELWKNAYDAYARNVKLHIFDGAEPVAAVFDDGHGMSYEEFVDRWLVVGTGTKYEQIPTEADDRNGLPMRTKQGQKGIGRLSSANLGPLLLVVSKRKEHDFVAALIDWRIFENPYLALSDLEIPVTRFSDRSQLFQAMPALFERLTDNVWGDSSNSGRAERLQLAWETYDRVVTSNDSEAEKPSEAIVSTIINAHFEKRHLEEWSVWSDEAEHGTALLVSDINYDLKAQLPSIEPDPNVRSIREAFFATLSAFTDPYVNESANESNAFDPDFSYEVITWSESVPAPIVEDERGAINRATTEQMEHVISGNVDADGVFRGQVKAFGEWHLLGSDYVIYPPKDFKVPKGPTTFVGPFSLHVATFELKRENSTLSEADHSRFSDLASQHSGFLVFRNGLRVLPYGRIDNDFFQIETRRSISAGREFWNSRRMFGRVAISREENPNLRDKAGREGFIDNRSAKALRTLVINILRRAAYEYFGQASELRKQLLPDINEKNNKAKADTERKELAKKNARKFRSRLKRNLPLLLELYDESCQSTATYKVKNRRDLEEFQSLINDFSNKLRDLRIPGAPSKLGPSEQDYRAFRSMYAEIQEHVREMESIKTAAIEEINPSEPENIAEKQMNSLAGQLQARLRRWKKSILTLQDDERDRVLSMFDERNKAFHGMAIPLVEQVRIGRLSLEDALSQINSIYALMDNENEETFQSYLDALEVMSENINIELIARQGASENAALRDDINRLNQIAQLGITVEILGHELNSNERMIREGIRKIRLGDDVPGTHLVEEGFDALSHQLEFLSPLKVSGTRTRRLITGKEILEYLQGFFKTVARSRGIKVDASERFLSIRVEEQPSRLFPVFVNLVNNSVYWMVHSHTVNPHVYLSVVEGNIVVSDNGPGIDPVDQENLFKMFFTRKVSDGRGIGLYLCRVNLMAGGHSIEYAKDRKFKLLSGANFVINLKGVGVG